MIALLTNDDGIDADGLKTLERIAGHFFDEIWVVAPDCEKSEIGHRVTTKEPLCYHSTGLRSYAVDGTPADCVRVALHHLLPSPPDWVLSGINHGGNLGRHDLVISGTMAAAREAAFAGCRSAAFSHFLHKPHRLDWDVAGARALEALELLLQQDLSLGEFWSVNLPHPAPGARNARPVLCPQDPSPLPVGYEEVEPGKLLYTGYYQDRARLPGMDIDVCFGGDTAISRISL